MNIEKLKAGWKTGWVWALFMFTVMVVVPMYQEKQFDIRMLVFGLVIWSIGGLCFGLWLNHSLGKKKRKKAEPPLSPSE
ncbi:MAG: hypothetical protein K9M54_10990 [Kiritimatiellales bacterium]|nr:hypothetical protein [Kiritimatiellales bacterium]MCF7864365.1 hypothetical protein [Kiritimatiellales bacterium]